MLEILVWRDGVDKYMKITSINEIELRRMRDEYGMNVLHELFVFVIL